MLWKACQHPRKLDRSRRHPDSKALAASVLSATAGAIAVSRAISDKHLSDDLLSTARKGIKMRLGLSEPARVGRTMQ
jgi:hypothetical protein